MADESSPMTALLEPATEHACLCGVDPARVWVSVADDVQPMCRACAARAASDPVFLAGLAEAYREPCEGVLPPFQPSKPPVVSPPPEPSERHRKSGAALAARVATDPELRQSFIELGHRLAAMRRACGQCGLVTNPGGLGLHQKATGHFGWEDGS